VRDEELRSRLQALAGAGQAAARPTTIAAVRRRGRRKVQGRIVVVLAGVLVAGASVQLLADAAYRRGSGPVPPVAPPTGPPAAVAPTTFVGQVGSGPTKHTVIIDARTGKVLRQVPGTDRQSNLAADAVVGPDLRTMYLPTGGPVPTAVCDRSWTQVDLATGTRRPAFGGLTGVGEFSLSTDGRFLAYVHTTGPGTPNGAFETSCHTEQLIVRELTSGRQRVWTIPSGASVHEVQLSPDATRLAYLLERAPGGQRPLHVLELAGTTSVTQGYDLPAAGDCPLSDPRFLGGSGRLLALGGRGCGAGPRNDLLVDYDLATGRVVSTMPLGLPGDVFSLDVDRSGRYVVIAAAGKPNAQRPATAYVLRNGHPQRVPLPGDCWQADW
jgi:hypothetical protein